MGDVKSRRKIAVVTGSRADYGHLYWLMKEIQADDELELVVIVTGMHLSPEFGYTYRQIEEDGFPIHYRLEMLLSSDTAQGVVKSTGLGLLGFAEAYKTLKPEIVVVLGDRFESLSASVAAMIMGIPLAHMHGGELSEGAVDESIRHAITKMAQIHFTATETYRKRVIQMGETPEAVYCFGSPGLDYIERVEFLPRTDLETFFKLDLSRTTFLVTFHPATREQGLETQQVEALLSALDHFKDVQLIFTLPNADAGGRTIAERIRQYARQSGERVRVYTSLGQVRYLSTLRHVALVLGNSSSGLIEAPSFRIPTVNIGDRQRGRVMADSVVTCDAAVEGIIAAVKKALSPEFKILLERVVNPYHREGASRMIKDALKSVELEPQRMKKKFYDIHFELGSDS